MAAGGSGAYRVYSFEQPVILFAFVLFRVYQSAVVLSADQGDCCRCPFEKQCYRWNQRVEHFANLVHPGSEFLVVQIDYAAGLFDHTQSRTARDNQPVIPHLHQLLRNDLGFVATRPQDYLHPIIETDRMVGLLYPRLSAELVVQKASRSYCSQNQDLPQQSHYGPLHHGSFVFHLSLLCVDLESDQIQRRPWPEESDNRPNCHRKPPELLSPFYCQVADQRKHDWPHLSLSNYAP